MSLPATTRMPMRPVWARHQRRILHDELPPPTEAEKHDAILVLSDSSNEWAAHELWREAFRILDEAGV